MGQKELIKKIRRKDTQQQLAERLSCSVKTIGNAENEKTSPSLKDFLRWCEIRNFRLHLIDLDVLEK